MQQIPLKDYDDGCVRPDMPVVGNVVTKTADYTMKVTDLSNVMTNGAATGKVVFTLPAAKKGGVARFLKQAAQDFWVTASGGAKINGGTANKSYKNTASELGTLTLWSNGTDWFVGASFGTWAADNA